MNDRCRCGNIAIEDGRCTTCAEPTTQPIADEALIERVAVVLADKFEWTDVPRPDLVYWREIARAAIAAMSDRLGKD